MNIREMKRLLRILRRIYGLSAVVREDGRRCASPETRIPRSKLRLTRGTLGRYDFDQLLKYGYIERAGERHIRITLRGMRAITVFQEELAHIEELTWNVNMGALPNA